MHLPSSYSEDVCCVLLTCLSAAAAGGLKHGRAWWDGMGWHGEDGEDDVEPPTPSVLVVWWRLLLAWWKLLAGRLAGWQAGRQATDTLQEDGQTGGRADRRAGEVDMSIADVVVTGRRCRSS